MERGKDMKLKGVINLFSGPGVGKSTIASGLFYRLKKIGVEVEMVHEYAKDLTYEERKNVLTADQLYIFAKQHRKLLRIKDAVDFAIVDSPLLLSSIYFDDNTNIYDRELFHNLVMNTFHKYPNFNIMLCRNSAYPYQEYGRGQNEQEAIKIDCMLETLLIKRNISFERLTSNADTIDILVKMLENKGMIC